jgi:hypothetical protein
MSRVVASRQAFTDMYADEVEVPVQCPSCGIVRMTSFPVLVILAALTKWQQMRLYAGCHDGAWDASPAELQAIRQHLGEEWIDKNLRHLEHRQQSLHN